MSSYYITPVALGSKRAQALWNLSVLPFIVSFLFFSFELKYPDSKIATNRLKNTIGTMNENAEK
jgi:hypothetical protein